MITFPNAKINLGLHVLARRKDGFHDIETVLYPVFLHDCLEIIPSSEAEAALYQYGHLLPDGENLCMKAYKLLKSSYDISPVEMHLIKHIPAGAGLGGGSSDAAQTLKMLSKIFNLRLKEDELEHLAAQLGSDCPFFIKNKALIAGGRGEVLSPVDLNLRGMYIVIVKPEVSISTAEAYARITPDNDRPSLRDCITKPVSEWKDCLINDFEVPVFRDHPHLSDIKEELYHKGAVYASMSGSGSAIFGLFNKEVSYSGPGEVFSAYL
jgi:4-diphosphocytidyl-2-C-methyl-D-erythritol kinase